MGRKTCINSADHGSRKTSLWSPDPSHCKILAFHVCLVGKEVPGQVSPWLEHLLVHQRVVLLLMVLVEIPAEPVCHGIEDSWKMYWEEGDIELEAPVP